MNRKRLLLLSGGVLLTLAAIGSWQWYVQSANGSAAERRGIAALAKGDVRSARVEFMNAVREQPLSSDAQILYARSLLLLDNGVDAELALQRVRRLQGNPAATRAMMADAKLLQGDAIGALNELSHSDIPEAEQNYALRTAAKAYWRMGRFGEADRAFNEALSVNAEDARTWSDLGQFRLAKGDQLGAIQAIDKALSIAPNDTRSLTLRGEITRGQYGLVAALPWFEKALERDPSFLPALIEYAATLSDLGRATQMLSVTRKILALDAGNDRAYFMQAVLAARAGKVKLATDLLERTEGRMDSAPATLLLRGILDIQSGRPQNAIRYLDRLVSRQPDNRIARTLLARAYVSAGELASGATVLAPIVAQRDADPYVLTLAARAQEGMGNRELANDMLARAAWPVRPTSDIFVNAEDARILATGAPNSSGTASDNVPYIRALLNAGQVRAAVSRAEGLARANTGAPAAQIIYGDTLAVDGRWPDAVQAYERAANIRFNRDVAMRLIAARLKMQDMVGGRQVLDLYMNQNPNDLWGQRLIAAAAMESKQWPLADYWLRAIQRQTGGFDAMLMANIAQVASERGEKQRAEKYAEMAYKLMPQNPIIIDVYGTVLLKDGRNVLSAIDLLEKAFLLVPDNVLFTLHLGAAYAEGGRKDEAKKLLDRAAKGSDPVLRADALRKLAAL